MRQERLMILEKVLSELPGYLGWMIGSCHFSFGKEAGGNTPGQMQHSCDLTVLAFGCQACGGGDPKSDNRGSAPGDACQCSIRNGNRPRNNRKAASGYQAAIIAERERSVSCDTGGN